MFTQNIHIYIYIFGSSLWLLYDCLAKIDCNLWVVLGTYPQFPSPLSTFCRNFCYERIVNVRGFSHCETRSFSLSVLALYILLKIPFALRGCLYHFNMTTIPRETRGTQTEHSRIAEEDCENVKTTFSFSLVCHQSLSYLKFRFSEYLNVQISCYPVIDKQITKSVF